MITFAYFLTRRNGLWIAKKLQHINGCPTEEEFVCAAQLRDAIAFLEA